MGVREGEPVGLEGDGVGEPEKDAGMLDGQVPIQSNESANDTSMSPQLSQAVRVEHVSRQSPVPQYTRILSLHASSVEHESETSVADEA